MQPRPVTSPEECRVKPLHKQLFERKVIYHEILNELQDS